MKTRFQCIVTISIIALYISCKSVGVSNLEYMIHNKTKYNVIVLWETPGSFFDSSEFRQDTIPPRQAEILAFLPRTISKGIGCDRGSNSTDTSGVISDISIFQLHYELDSNTSKFYKFNAMECGKWKQSSLNSYKTFILPVNESDFE